MQELHISVRNLVEFIFRAGDIDNRAGKLASAEAMMEVRRESAMDSTQLLQTCIIDALESLLRKCRST